MFAKLRILFLITLLATLVLVPGVSFSTEATNQGTSQLLTEAERQWIANHPVITVRISRDYPPFEFFDDGQFKGIAFDYLQIISERTGLEFRPTSDMPWKEALQRIEDRSGVDLILLITYRKERESFLNFTRDYISFPEVIFTRKDKLFVSGTDDLIGRTVATENDFISSELIKRDIPQVNLLEVDTTEEALRAVALGEADAYIGNLAVGSYLIDELGLVDLKIAASSNYDDDGYAMGIRKDWPELAAILEKTLDSLTAEEHQQLKQKWFVIRYEHGLHITDILFWVFLVTIVAGIIIYQYRRVTRQKVQIREELYRELVEGTTAALATLDKDFVCTYANREVEAITGVDADQLVGLHALEFVHPDDKDDTLRLLNSLSPDGETSVHINNRMLSSNGQLTYMSWLVNADYDTSGKPDHFRAVGRDITTEVEAEQKLRENEAYFRSVIQISPDIITLVRMSDHMVLEINDAGVKKFGYGLDEMYPEIGHTFWVDAAQRDAYLRLLEETGQVDNMEVSFQPRGGGLFHGLISSRIIEYRGEQCRIAFIRDVTDIKEATKALQSSESRYRRLSQEFEAVLDGIVDSLILFDAELRVVWGNKGATRQFGVAADEMVGMTCHELWGCENQELCDSCVSGVFGTGKSCERVRNKEDGSTWGVKGYPVFGRDDKVSNVIQIASDLSEKMQLREEATRASHLAALGGLSAGIAHEINNPTGLVLMALPFVKDAMRDILPLTDDYVEQHPGLMVAGLPYETFRDEILQTIEDMQSGAQRIKGIVDDLKDFAREKSGDEDELVDVEEMVNKSLRLLRNVLKNSTDNFSLEIEENLPKVKGSSQRLEQVLVNLVQNACLALTSKQASVSLAAFYNKDKNSVVLQVADEGCGIPVELIEKVTDPFFTTRREEGGTGLGLSVSARIIEEHGGVLTIVSTPEKGSTFKVELPAIDGDAI